MTKDYIKRQFSNFYNEVIKGNFAKSEDVETQNRNLVELTKVADNVNHKLVESKGDKIHSFDVGNVTIGSNALIDNNFLIKKRNSHTLKAYSDNTARFFDFSMPINNILKEDLANCGVWFYIPKSTFDNLSYIDFQMGNWNGTSVSSGEKVLTVNKTSMNIGWNFHKFTESVNGNTFNGLRIMVVDKSSNSDTTHYAKEVYFDSIVKGYNLKPTVLLAFDNCEDTSLYQYCYQYAKSRGIVGTFAYQNGLTPDSKGTGVTRSHLNEMINHGWDVTQYDGNPMGGGISAISAFNNQLRSGGLDMYCYFPRYNDVTADIWDNLSEMGFKMSRFANSNPYINAIGLNTYNCCGLTFSNDATYVKDKIDSIITDKKMLAILVHKPLDERDETQNNCLKTDYEEVLTYLSTKQKSGDIQIITFKELYYASMFEDVIRTYMV